jgi:hypothetical protein
LKVEKGLTAELDHARLQVIKFQQLLDTIREAKKQTCPHWYSWQFPFGDELLPDAHVSCWVCGNSVQHTYLLLDEGQTNRFNTINPGLTLAVGAERYRTFVNEFTGKEIETSSANAPA